MRIRRQIAATIFLLCYLGHDVNGLLCYGNILVLNLEQENGLVRVGAVHRVRMLRGPGGKNKIEKYLLNNIDKITIKTPNPKCRLYWCL